MKVRIGFTVDIDPEVWAAEYGLERDEVRADVQEHVRNSVTEHLRSLGMLTQEN